MGPEIGGESCSASPGPFGESAEDSGADLLLWIALAIYSLGVVCGWTCRSLLGFIRVSRPPAARHPNNWGRLTARALRFVRRRRAVSLAFSAFREHSLRPSEQGQPTSRRRAHVGSTTPRPSSSSVEFTPLREGPALSHGSN